MKKKARSDMNNVFELEEKTVAEQALGNDDFEKYISIELCEMYIKRTNTTDAVESGLYTVIELNPEALGIASNL